MRAWKKKNYKKTLCFLYGHAVNVSKRVNKSIDRAEVYNCKIVDCCL